MELPSTLEESHEYIRGLSSKNELLKIQIEELFHKVADQVEEIRELGDKVEQETKEKAELSRKVGTQAFDIMCLKSRVEKLVKRLFGRSSEKRILETRGGPIQESFNFTYLEEEKEETGIAVETTEIKSHKRVKNRTKRLEGELKDAEDRFPECLPREKVVIDDGQEQGEKILVKVSERLCVKPSQLYVEEVHRVVRKDKEGEIKTPELPATVLPRTCVDASFLAWIVVQKFMWHLPLYRQEQMLKAQGFRISRDTLIRYVIDLSKVLSKLYEAQIEEVFLSEHLYGDETPVIVGKGNKGEKSYTTSRFWPFMSKEEIVFLYAATRGADEISEYLEGFKGKLQVDGYKVYETISNRYPEIVLVFCWAHVRRKFIEAEKSYPEEANVALRYIGLLYRVEELANNNKTLAQVLNLRKKYSQKIFNGFKEWVQKTLTLPNTLPKSSLGEALSYAYNRFIGLERYIDDPNLSIDSNPIERAIRPVALGRKNWLFCASEVGAEAACTFYTFIANCKLNKIDAYDYFVDLFNRVGDHSQLKLTELLPKYWKPLQKIKIASELEQHNKKQDNNEQLDLSKKTDSISLAT